MTTAERLTIIIVAMMIVLFFVRFFIPALVERINDRIPIVPAAGQPVCIWRSLNRRWFFGFLALAVLQLISITTIETVLVALGFTGFFGWGGYVPGAARRHARDLQKLRAGHCAWCGQCFGRERPGACPACREATVVLQSQE